MKPQLSLKGRALQWLSQREHSRAELRTKLLRVARGAFADHAAALALADAGAASDALDAAGAAEGVPRAMAHRGRPPRHDTPRPPVVTPTPPPPPEDAVDAVLAWLEAHHYLSDARFVESRVHARAGRYGNLRIRQELAQHGVSLSPDEAQALKTSELSRARDVWQRKFGEPPNDPAERARQMRFLGGRGFSPEVIRRVVQGAGDADDDR